MFVLLGFISAALLEYLLHRYYLHMTTHVHITKHHKIFRKQYEDPSYGYKDIVSNPGYIIASSLLALVLTIVLSFYYKNSYIIYVTALVYLIWVEVVHYLFHSPSGYKFENLNIFQLLKEHHHQHHIRFKINYGIGSTFFDHLFRTKL